ncbi:MAG: voltage-gated potassium channel [Limisphaerales bacterium]|jgi:voltage-gated potassium channel
MMAAESDKKSWQHYLSKVTLALARLADLLRHRNARGLLRFLAMLVSLITVYAFLFQLLMAYEGQQHSFVTGFYWTLSTMSTLGYGDISFVSDAGRIFSIVVLLSGIVFMLVLLPLTFIELFYEPWMASRAASRIPRAVDPNMSGHVILTFYGPVVKALIPKLTQYKYPYVIISPAPEEVTRLRNLGVNAICGELNEPDTFVRARVEHAALVATTQSDIVNTSIVFTIRGITKVTPIIATARTESSKEVLKLAGSNRVLDLSHLMAEGLARRAIGGRQFSHVVGQIDDLLIAEVDASRTTLIGRSYSKAQVDTSISIVGFWARGHFEGGQPEAIIEGNSVLVLAGSAGQLKEFDALYRNDDNVGEYAPVIVVGGGRVGRSTARALARRGIDYRIVEIDASRIEDPDKYVHGSAAERDVLKQAGIEKAPTVIITTGDDETNVYLTILIRLLQPDVQIIGRSTFESHVAPMHRAGADIVMSYASMGANAFFNLLKRSDLLMVAEGLDVFKVAVPKSLAGKTLADTHIRRDTHCTVIGIDSNDETRTNPQPDAILPADGEIVLIGTPENESAFLKLYSET